MPTSAIGEKGFTLVELLAVLTILSLATAVVLLVVPAGNGSVRADAEKLAARIALIRNEAIIAARPTSVAIDGSGYRFEERRGGDWVPISGKQLGQTAWPVGMAPPSAIRISFDTTGAADRDATVALVQAGETATVEIDAGGRVYVGQ